MISWDNELNVEARKTLWTYIVWLLGRGFRLEVGKNESKTGLEAMLESTIMSVKMYICLYSSALELKKRNMELVLPSALKVRKAEGVKAKIPAEKKSFSKGDFKDFSWIISIWGWWREGKLHAGNEAGRKKAVVCMLSLQPLENYECIIVKFEDTQVACAVLSGYMGVISPRASALESQCCIKAIVSSVLEFAC